MITMPYATVLVAVLAAAALGATGAAWMLCGVLVENRVLVTRAQRWQSRMSHLSRPVLSTVDVLFARTSLAIALRGNEVRVRLALRRTERLLRKSRRQHTGTHRLDLTTPVAVPHRFAGMAAGWLPRPATTVSPSDVDTSLPEPVESTPTTETTRPLVVVETSPEAYRPIRTHRPSRTRRLAPRPLAGRPPVARQRASRSSRALEAAVA